MEQRNLYDAATFDAVMARIEALHATTKPEWGTMDAAQMMAHCAEIQEVANGKPLKNTPWFVMLFKGMIRKSVVSPKPFPRGIRTHPQYIMSSSGFDFEEQRDRLQTALRAMYDEGRKNAGGAVHIMFGRMNADEKGWAMYKHVDHHLTQFGV